MDETEGLLAYLYTKVRVAEKSSVPLISRKGTTYRQEPGVKP